MGIKDALFEAFREDHATLGRGLFDLRTMLAAGEIEDIRKAAERLDRDVGAHIAFEEREFYPALKPFLSQEEIDDMYQDHAEGLLLICEILNSTDAELAAPSRQAALTARIEKMEAHVSECGELFGAMGGLSADEQKALLEKLKEWRKRAPRWTDFAETPPTPGL
ncbi:MAG: hemerythrin domain-containing protein [Pseudomonadota bacterium]